MNSRDISHYLEYFQFLRLLQEETAWTDERVHQITAGYNKFKFIIWNSGSSDKICSWSLASCVFMMRCLKVFVMKYTSLWHSPSSHLHCCKEDLISIFAKAFKWVNMISEVINLTSTKSVFRVTVNFTSSSHQRFFWNILCLCPNFITFCCFKREFTSLCPPPPPLPPLRR